MLDSGLAPDSIYGHSKIIDELNPDAINWWDKEGREMAYKYKEQKAFIKYVEKVVSKKVAGSESELVALEAPAGTGMNQAVWLTAKKFLSETLLLVELYVSTYR